MPRTAARKCIYLLYCVLRRATETAPQALPHEQGADSTDDLQYRSPITIAVSMLPTGIWNMPLYIVVWGVRE